MINLTIYFDLLNEPISTKKCSNFFNGILLSASDRIYEGDTVQISKSGFRGNVERLGWLETGESIVVERL